MAIPPQPGRTGGLGEKIETTLLRFLSRFLNAAQDALSGILRFALDTFLEGIEPVLITAYRPLLSTLRNTDGCPPELQTLIDHSLSGEHQAGAALLTMVGSGLGGGLMGSIGSAVFGGWTRWANSKARQLRADIGTLQAMRRRGAITDEEYRIGLAELGWGERLAGQIWQVTQPRPDPATLVAAAYRMGTDLGTVRDELTMRGFTPADIEKILTVLKPIPSAGDLIRMAVREAWSDAVAARYGYDQDFPSEFAEWMKRQGFDPEWARRWWRAHWEVPGPTMAREMLHRTSMTEADYATLLKIADYPVTFRKWMTEVAYEPYTRVDVRRMYQVGVLKTYAELVRAYKDLGYDDNKAQHLADFTVLEYGESEREATKSEVLEAYGIGRLSREEARKYLDGMGYPDWAVDAFLSRIDLGRTTGIAKQQISHVQTMYVNGQIDRTAVYATLSRIPIPSSEIDRYLEEWEIARTAKIARPSRADLLRFFLQNEMTEQEFRAELRGYRLSERYIDWYVADAKRKLTLQAKKELADAKADLEKARKEEIKNEYEIRLADLDVQIANANLAIADLKASATREMTLEEIDRLSKLVIEYQVGIKNVQVAKAEMRKQYLEKKAGV
jgi:hypothetical protein